MGSKQNIQKRHKSKKLCSNWIQDMKKGLGSWEVTHLLHDASIDSSIIRPSWNANVSWHRKNLEAHVSHIILHMLHLATSGETARIDTCYSPFHCLPSEPLLPYDLVHICFHVRQNISAHVIRQDNYAHFAPDMSNSLQTNIMVHLWSHLTMISIYLWPKPILAQISLIVTVCTLNFRSLRTNIMLWLWSKSTIISTHFLPNPILAWISHTQQYALSIATFYR